MAPWLELRRGKGDETLGLAVLSGVNHESSEIRDESEQNCI